MLVGYARVSTSEQCLDMQKDALLKAGCEKIFTDIISGSKSEREGLGEAMQFIRQGDTLVVWKLDRLGRSLKHLIEVVTLLQKGNIELRSLHENIDTTSSSGRLAFHLFSALAEFERELIRERTKAGLAAARSRGRIGGRKKLMDDKKIAMAIALYQNCSNDIGGICRTLKVSRSTFYRYLKHNGKNSQNQTPSEVANH